MANEKHQGPVQSRFLQNCSASVKRAGMKPPKKSYGGPYRRRHGFPVPTEQIWVWMKDMGKWGKDVRKDIRRLEKKCGIRLGDPGDPPPPPEDDE